MYDIQEEDLDGFTEHSQFLVSAETSSLQTQLPVIELLKVVTKIFLLFVFTVETQSLSQADMLYIIYIIG